MFAYKYQRCDDLLVKLGSVPIAPFQSLRSEQRRVRHASSRCMAPLLTKTHLSSNNYDTSIGGTCSLRYVNEQRQVVCNITIKNPGPHVLGASIHRYTTVVVVVIVDTEKDPTQYVPGTRLSNVPGSHSWLSPGPLLYPSLPWRRQPVSVQTKPARPVQSV